MTYSFIVGVEFPPLPVVAVLFVILIVSGWYLISSRPVISDRLVLGTASWIVAGGILHALHQLDVFSSSITPLFNTGGVYLTMAAAYLFTLSLAVAIQDDPDIVIGVAGSVIAIFAGILSVLYGTSLSFRWPIIIVIATAVVTVGTWQVLTSTVDDITSLSGYTGLLVIFGHLLDGISTAVGFDVLGAAERVLLSRIILEFGASLPTADILGGGWVFIVTKLLLSIVVLYLFRGYLSEEPEEARVFLTVIAAVGLGPATHNLVLFMFA